MVIFTVVLFFAIKFTFPKFRETLVMISPLFNNFPLQVSLGVSMGGGVVPAFQTTCWATCWGGEMFFLHNTKGKEILGTYLTGFLKIF